MTTVRTPTLSPRQLDVLRLSAAGLSRSEIADELHLTFKAVSFHAARAARRLGVVGREAAIAEARRLGLLEGCGE